MEIIRDFFSKIKTIITTTDEIFLHRCPVRSKEFLVRWKRNTMNTRIGIIDLHGWMNKINVSVEWEGQLKSMWNCPRIIQCIQQWRCDKIGRCLRRDNKNVEYKGRRRCNSTRNEQRGRYSHQVVILEKSFGPPIPPDNSLQWKETISVLSTEIYYRRRNC